MFFYHDLDDLIRVLIFKMVSLLVNLLSTITLPEFSHQDLGYDFPFSVKGFNPNFAAACLISRSLGAETASLMGIFLPSLWDFLESR